MSERYPSILDMFRLDGKVAIVTGGAKGIGFALAEELGRRGAALLIADLAGAAAAADRLAVGGVRALGVEVDVASEADTAPAGMNQGEPP